MLDDLVTSIALYSSAAGAESSAHSTAAATTAAAATVPATDRIVIVSNFTSTLDVIQSLGKLRKWRYLRIDGSIAAERRTKMIAYFNNPAHNFNIMLLSAKAGGVGINLVGANRLVMFDPDWNPATDQQAMGRVWREGQRKPVFIYRLVSSGTVEETILTRQTGKVCHVYLFVLLGMHSFHVCCCYSVLSRACRQS